MANKDKTGKTQAAENIPSNLKNRRKQQQEALLQSLQPSERERQTQKQADLLLSSARQGIADIKDQPISMPFIRGQAAGVERQTQARLEPLQRRLSRLQAQRQGQAKTAETQLGFTRQDIQTAREEREGLAKRERERKETIRSIAEDARQRGAGQEEVAAILAAETPEQAQQAAASVAPVQPEQQERFEMRSISGGGLLEVEKDPQTGEIVGTRVVRQPDGGADDDTPTGDDTPSVEVPDFDTFVEELIDTPEGQEIIQQVGLQGGATGLGTGALGSTGALGVANRLSKIQALKNSEAVRSLYDRQVQKMRGAGGGSDSGQRNP